MLVFSKVNTVLFSIATFFLNEFLGFCSFTDFNCIKQKKLLIERNMRKRLSLRKSKRVNWASDAKLCQVKLFLSEDCPSKIGCKSEDHYQAKTSRMLQSDETRFDDPAPGFGGKMFNQTCVPHIKWKCPPMFILNNDWRVVAGEHSEETRIQKVRELRVLEAIYPCQSAIPSSPSVSSGLEESDYDDHETPLIPVNPIEEEDAGDYESTPFPLPICSSSVAVKQEEAVRLAHHNFTLEESKTVINEKPVGISSGLEADTVAATSAAVTAIRKSNENLIDIDLLVKILSDPKMIETLSKDSGLSAAMEVTPVYEPKPATSSISFPTIKYHSTVFQKPLNESSHMYNIRQQTTRLASDTLSSDATQILNIPLSSAELTYKNSDQFCKNLKSSSNASFSVSIPVTLSPPATLSSSGPRVSVPSTYCASLQDKSNRRPVDVLELPEMVLPTSSSQYLGVNDFVSKYISHSDKHFLHNPMNWSRKSSQPSTHTTMSVSKSTSQASMLKQEPIWALSPTPVHLLNNCRQDMVSPTEREIQSLSPEIHPVRRVSQYSSSSDKPFVSSVSSLKTPIVKDISYYKSLVELHGIERRASEEEDTLPYRPRASEVTVVSGKPCKFFNSSKGCRNGSTCPFLHDKLKLKAGSLSDAYRSSKRIKLNRKVY